MALAFFLFRPVRLPSCSFCVAFCTALRSVLVATLANLAAHKSAAMREAFEGVGAQMLFLPPYSPDMNPIDVVEGESVFMNRRGPYIRHVGGRHRRRATLGHARRLPRLLRGLRICGIKMTVALNPILIA